MLQRYWQVKLVTTTFIFQNDGLRGSCKIILEMAGGMAFGPSRYAIWRSGVGTYKVLRQKL